MIMTARHSIERLADCAPVADPESWPARKPPSPDTIWRRNMAWRDADAKKYGEPRNPNEFYRGRKP